MLPSPPWIRPQAGLRPHPYPALSLASLASSFTTNLLRVLPFTNLMYKNPVLNSNLEYLSSDTLTLFVNKALKSYHVIDTFVGAGNTGVNQRNVALPSMADMV